MPYNTRRKSLSLPSLGVHIPVSQAARAAASVSNKNSASAASSSSTSPCHSQSDSMDSQPCKRAKRSHSDPSPIYVDSNEPSSTSQPSRSKEGGAEQQVERQICLSAIHDDIVEGVVTQLQRTANRPHLIKELALVLSLQLRSVQNSANQCAIISSRLASFMKRPYWTTETPCPIAKELEPVHPRRTYYYLTTLPRQPLPDSNSFPATTQTKIQALQIVESRPQSTLPFLDDEPSLTPSASLTDDSISDDSEPRTRDLSASPEFEFPSPEFDDFDEDFDSIMPATPVVSIVSSQARAYSVSSDRPPLEKAEREFSQTASFLQKRKWNDSLAPSDVSERVPSLESGYRDEPWTGDNRGAVIFLASPMMKPMGPISIRKDDDMETWARPNHVVEWDQGAESIEIDELDCLLDGC